MMWLGSLIFVLTFLLMEFLAWATHKYVMHGFMWHWHADHHKKDHDNWFERNDLFFIFYAIVSMSFILVGDNTSMWFGIPIGFGILTCNNLRQAKMRALISKKNKGKEVASGIISILKNK